MEVILIFAIIVLISYYKFLNISLICFYVKDYTDLFGD